MHAPTSSSAGGHLALRRLSSLSSRPIRRYRNLISSMNPLELRKIIQIGYRFDQLEAAPLLGADGRNLEPVSQRYWGTFAFWVPAPQPFKRGKGVTMVPTVLPHELQALRDGAIIEHVQEFEFPKEPPAWLLKQGLMKVWEALAVHSIGVFQGAPQDHTTKPIFQFESVTEASS